MGILGSRKEGDSRSAVPISIQRRPNAFARRWNRVFSFSLLDILFNRKRRPPLPRTVVFGLPLPDRAWAPTKTGRKQLKDGLPEDQIDRAHGQKVDPSWRYPSNEVTTSKYNLISFLPKNILEQFRRIANIFFLIVVILQFFPRFSNVSPALAALPLLVVLGITALKDAYEDLKRHQSDRAINVLPVRILKSDRFHNPNMTDAVTGFISLETFGLGWLISKPISRSAKKNNKQLESEAGQSNRHWWGAKRRRRRTGSPKDMPGGGDLQSAKDKAGKLEGLTDATHAHEDDLYRDQQHQSEESYGAGGARWEKTNWQSLRTGDFVKLINNEAIPADIIICASSEDENVAYVETKNLDGETNLKSRHAVPELTHLRTAESCADARFTVDADAPSVDMFKYNAAAHMADGRTDKSGTKPLVAPVTLNTVLLRGTILRNTEWVIGVVMATGIDTKIVLNSGGTPSKRSKVERQMNPQVFLNLFILALMCIMCAIGDSILEIRYYDQNAPWMAFADRSDDNPRINGLVSFANAMITFQNIVPISLYISIEFVRLAQAFFIWADDDIMYDPNKRRTAARSWNLSDDLGQIEYIFSDKTGTLTQNVMQFRRCTIAGKVYRGDGLMPKNTIVDDTERVGSSDSEGSSEDTRVNPSEKANSMTALNSKDKLQQEQHQKVKLAPEVSAPFHDATLLEDLGKSGSHQAELIDGFFTNLALCHTVLAEDDGDGVIQYKAQSPDEAALVQAAADVGYMFIGRDKNILKIQTPSSSDIVEYELLNIIEFSSARKRMSVIVRKVIGHDNKVMVLMKGADNIIFERLSAGQDAEKAQTDKRLDEFANEGLRTLTLSYRMIDEEDYVQWEREYTDASVAIDDREDKMEAVADTIEREATLLGATAIEDKLQDGVPETLVDLKRAGIKVWVCTGDKLETAVAIGLSSNLLAQDMNLIIVRGGEYGEKNSAYAQMKKAISQFFDEGAEVVDHLEDLHRDRIDADEKRYERPGMMPRHSTGAMSGVSGIVGDDNGDRPGGFGLVIEGTSLRHAFAEPQTKELLLELATRCKVVICCRTSPLQKALVVRLVREGLGAMCLAIGDGANDVSMIQAADVGVGVAGEEGLQAVNSSDYAIGQFRYLQRLLLVHGHWSYMRNSNMIVNFFYKEIIGIGILFFYQFYCAFSTTTVYEYTYILFWNVFWTLLPVLAMGVFDRNISYHVLVQVPELYHYGRRGKLFGLKRFSWYMIDGTYQSAICFFFVLYAYQTTSSRSDGYDPALYEYSTLMAIAAVWAANLYNGLNTHAWTAFVWVFVAVGPALILIYSAIYNVISPDSTWSTVYGNNYYLFTSPIFWFGFLFCLILSLAPRYIVRYYKELYRPTDIDILKWVDKVDPDHDYYHDPHIPGGAAALAARKHTREIGLNESHLAAPALERTRTDMSGLAPINSRGFAFDQEDRMGETVVGRQLRTYSSSLHSRQSGEGNRPRSGSMRRLAVAFGVKPSSSPKKEGKDLRKKSLLSLGRSRAASRADGTDMPNPSPTKPRPVTPAAEPTPSSASERPVTPTTSARPVTPIDRSVTPIPESAPLSPSSNFMTPPETPISAEPQSYQSMPADDACATRRSSSPLEMSEDASALPPSIPIPKQHPSN